MTDSTLASCDESEKILAAGDPDDAEGLARATAHLSECSRCAEFAAKLEELRSALGGVESPAAPAELCARTVDSCHAELARPRSRGWARAGFAGLATLTCAWTGAALVQAVGQGELTREGAWALTLVWQNVLALLVSPLLLCRRSPSLRPSESLE